MINSDWSMQNTNQEAPPSISIREPAQTDALSAHFLPCKIQCLCSSEEDNKTCRHPAKVDVYFDPVIRTTAAGSLGEGYRATFRGRPLRGAILDVPEGFTGAVLKECADAEVIIITCNILWHLIWWIDIHKMVSCEGCQYSVDWNDLWPNNLFRDSEVASFFKWSSVLLVSPFFSACLF